MVLKVTDENDNEPVFIYPSPPESRHAHNDTLTSSTVAHVWNRATSGHVIATVRATDADVGVNARIDYVIVTGNDDEMFRIDGPSGRMTLAKNLRGNVDNGVSERLTLCAAILGLVFSTIVPTLSVCLSVRPSD